MYVCIYFPYLLFGSYYSALFMALFLAMLHFLLGNPTTKLVHAIKVKLLIMADKLRKRPIIFALPARKIINKY